MLDTNFEAKVKETSVTTDADGKKTIHVTLQTEPEVFALKNASECVLWRDVVAIFLTQGKPYEEASELSDKVVEQYRARAKNAKGEWTYNTPAPKKSDPLEGRRLW